jgi:hypothetical protein
MLARSNAFGKQTVESLRSSGLVSIALFASTLTFGMILAASMTSLFAIGRLEMNVAGIAVSLDISLGAILQVVAMLVVGLGFAFKIGARVDTMGVIVGEVGRRVSSLENSVSDWRKSDGEIQVLKANHMNLEKLVTLQAAEIALLRQGKNFIQREIDGVYTRSGKAKE